MVDALFQGSPGSFGTGTRQQAPVASAGIPIDALTEALRLNNLTLATTSPSEHFYSSSPRLYNDPTVEVIEIGLRSPFLVSRVTFEVSRFPHNVTMEWFEPSSKTWLQVLDRRQNPVVFSNSDSLPAVISSSVTNHHPQHYGDGHWLRVAWDITPVLSSQFRIRLHRSAPGRIIAPRSARNQQVPYSLALCNVNLAQDIRYKLDVPYRPPISVTERDTFTSSVDMLGSTVSFAMRENRADALLSGGQWKSEPQPIAEAVVNLYADLRSGPDGDPQVIDRIYLDPLYQGTTLNLYSSTEVPTGDFAADDDALLYPRSSVNGRVELTNLGATFFNEFGYIEVSNSGGVVGFDPTREWWYAEAVTLRSPPNQPDPVVICDFGPKVLLQGRTLRVSFGDASAALENVPESFVFGLIFRDGVLTLCIGDPLAENAEAWTRVIVPTPESIRTVSVMRWGAQVDTEEIGIGNHHMIAAVLKQERYRDALVAIAKFQRDPWGYVRPNSVQAADTTRNALLRFSPEHVNPLDAGVTGFVGGPGDIYGEIVWTPVNRDFKAAKGFLNFPAVKARFFKLEFTHLVAQPYTATVPIRRTVKTFATATPEPEISVGTLSTRADTGATINQALGGLQLFTDDNRIGRTVSTQVVGGVSPTEALTSSDPTVNPVLRDQTALYGFTSWQQPRAQTPRHIAVEKHVYQTVEIEHREKVAFFAGLHGITFYRRDYTADDDTERYDFHFLDEAAIDFTASGAVQQSGTDVWRLDNGLTAGPGLDLSAHSALSSAPLRSQRSVRGIQFATVQSPPRQLLADADFSDPFLLHWEPVGDARELTPSALYSSTIGETVLLTRESVARNWDTLEGYSWDDIETLVLDDDGNPGTTWDDLDSTQTGGLGSMGGIQSEWVTPSATGRLYVAARVVTSKPLTQNLVVQLVGEDGSILGEKAFAPQSGQVNEYYFGVTIGEDANRIGRAWTQVEQEFTSWDMVEGLPWYDIDSELPHLHQKVRARLVQFGPSADSWYVDTLSLYEDPIVWEFSRDGGNTFYPVYDIRNNPRGVFLFPETGSTTAVTNALVWRVNGYGPNLDVSALFIRPWYADLGTGISHREGLMHGGPNRNPIDHFPPITQDPPWMTWQLPVPIDWWFFFRQQYVQRYIAEQPTVITIGYGTWAAPSSHQSSNRLATLRGQGSYGIGAYGVGDYGTTS